MLRGLFIAIFLFLSACTQDTAQVLSGKTMGTTYTLKTPDTKIDQNRVEKRLGQLNQVFSNWDPNSEVSRLNRHDTDQWLSVSDDLYTVLEASQVLYQQTQGFFDPGIGRLIELWGFGVSPAKGIPSATAIAQAQAQSSIAHLELKDGQVKKHKDIHLNLSAIAKGYALDQLGELLSAQGAENFMLEIGGEVLVRGSNDNQPWRIGVEMPDNQQPILLALNNQAVATSGDYRNYFYHQGQAYAHILNPKTGAPAKSDIASVSVIADSTLLSDAYATALQAMGSQRAMQLAKKYNLQVLMILNKDKEHQVIKLNL